MQLFILGNLILCVIYLFFGRLPFFKNGLFYNVRSGILVTACLFAFLVYSILRRYLAGTSLKTEYALRELFAWRYKAWTFPFVFAPIAILGFHAWTGILQSWWGNVLFGVVTLLAAWIYYDNLVEFTESGSRRIRTMAFLGQDVGTVGTFLAGSWAVAALFRGIAMALLPNLRSLMHWAMSG